MINKIWFFFIIVGSLFCLFTNNIELLNKEILNSAKSSLEMITKIFPVIALWLGLMNIATKSGLLKKLSHLLSPVLYKLFPEIPKNHESIDFIATNVISNMFGLGSAATPSGLKAMKSLQTLNKKKDTASRSMITFLVLNTSGVTLISTTIISLRIMHNSKNPTEIVFACILATFLSTLSGLIMDRLLSRKNKI
ncbi:MAG: nucleoside recognition domain-containing protein [Bacilli bacterium]|nr:nucleoside recognition domain-containing protein [Bacilli bacterium]